MLGCCLLLSLAPISEWRWGSHAALNATHSSAPSSASAAATAAAPHTHQSVSIAAAHTHGGEYGHSVNSVPRWWLESPTSFGISVLFLCSISYFALQILALSYRGRFTTSKGQRVLLHHILSIVGLGSCVVSGRDGPLALVGFVLAESSNPPYFVQQLCKYATKSHWRSSGVLRSSSSGTTGRVLRWLLRPLLYLCLSMDLGLLHVLTFLLTRLMVLQFTAHAVMPFASLMTTKITATALTLLSAVQFLDHLPALQDGPDNAFKVERLSIVSELREMQEWCYEVDASSALHGATSGSDEDHSSNGSSRATSRRHHPPSSAASGSRGSAGNSPRTAAVAPAPDDSAADAKRSTTVTAARKKLLWS